MKIATIDCQYVFPRFAASYLVADGKRGIVVENNTTHSVPLILDAIRGEGLAPSAIDYVIVTHVHLDHAGGSSALMRECKNAKLLAHPRAAPHLIDPSKLVSSARRVYGDEVFEKLYGQIDPIPESRVRVMQDEEILEWQGTKLRFLHTRGHANHHFCVQLDEQAIFTGDAFGLAYPDIQDKGLFIIPSTSPTDFDAAEARKSIERIRDSGAKEAYLTHFGAVTDLAGAARQLTTEIDFSEKLLNSAQRSGEPDNRLQSFCEAAIRERFSKILSARGEAFEKKAWSILKMDLELNAAGIAHVARKRREKEAAR